MFKLNRCHRYIRPPSPYYLDIQLIMEIEQQNEQEGVLAPNQQDNEQLNATLEEEREKHRRRYVSFLCMHVIKIPNELEFGVQS